MVTDIVCDTSAHGGLSSGEIEEEVGGTIHDWSHSTGDLGLNSYDPSFYFSVQAPNGAWGWIPDTYFVRDKINHLGLPAC